MGAGAVWQELDCTFTTDSCKVVGPPSSFRAEAAGMHMAVDGAPRDVPLTILTDSMNVLYALRAFNTSEFDRDMRRQRNADIIRDILTAINLRSAPTHLVKVKSHRGIHLNELADEAAGMAKAAPAEIADTRYCDFEPEGDGFHFTWVDEEGDIVTTDAFKTVVKRWHATQGARTLKEVRTAATFGGQFLTDPDAGRHLLQLSKHHRSWSQMEERRWMQQVGHVLPLNGYLHRIGRHPTGCCPWHPGIRESQMHFQCMCSEFQENRTAAHHDIAKAIISELREQKPSGWTFWYETPLSLLPWQFAWANPLEARKQKDRRPDGVAFHAVTKRVVFLEVSRPMDQEDNMAKASERKGEQYTEAVQALYRAQQRRDMRGETTSASTLPILVGVRGSVEYAEAVREFSVFGLSKRKLDKVLAAGVRAAITAGSNMISARAAALPFAHLKRGRRRQRRSGAAT
jgi:ribonuclease HI